MRRRREDEKEENTLRVQGGYSGVHQVYSGGTVGVQSWYRQGRDGVQ